MDAVAIKVSERPVIALTKNINMQVEFCLALAHELGHIACGHLENNSLLIDEKLMKTMLITPRNRGQCLRDRAT